MTDPSTGSDHGFPTGTVTFLFTDIEGSTRLAQQYPAAWSAAHARHHVILQSAIESHGGHIFQVVGDAFCAAFATAPDALAAALAAQRALTAEAWGKTPIRVRMGLHTGAAELRDGDYHGYLTLAHVQRVMSTAYGGQTLVSNASAALLAGQLQDGVTLRDAGEHRLKGLSNPEHLWQLAAYDLPQDFPPLQSLNTIPNNLPIQVTSFVGRERELSELQRLMPATRLLTLTGSGGTGKTRLSLQLAAEVLDTYKDGVWFVELAPLSDPKLVPLIIASVLGVREEPGRPLLNTLCDWLRPKQLLFILDNCEHLIDACASFADAVLHGSRETRILASSREALGISGELAWRVPSLPSPSPGDPMSTKRLEQYAAVRLFIERARFAQPAFTVTDGNAPAVAQICYRLDGIPLAIELAAARVKAMRVDQVAARLDDRFRLLTGGSRTALPRQQTLRALIDWSYGLLSQPERALLRRLAVFAGGWTLEAAEAVCADDGLEPVDIVDLLTRLLDKSLVVLDEQAGETRYRLLETVRQYAREKLLDASESEQLRDRHLDFFVNLTDRSEPYFGNTATPWHARMRAELDNLRYALEWACERNIETARWLMGQTRWFWILLPNEGRTWYDRVLISDGPQATTPGIALALLGAGEAYVMLASHEEALNLLQHSAALWRLLDGKTKLAEALAWTAYSLIQLGRPAEACAIFETNESLIREFATPPALVTALSYWGRALSNLGGDGAKVIALQEEALSIARRLNNGASLGLVWMNKGYHAQQEGNYDAANRYHLEELAHRRAGGAWLQATALSNVADVACLQERYADARPLYEEALELFQAIGVQLVIARESVGLAYVVAHEGDTERAAALIAQSLLVFRERTNPYGIALCLATYGELLRLQGRPEEVVRLLTSPALQPIVLRNTPIPAYRIKYDSTLAAARAALDPAAFATAWEAGKQLTLEKAVALVLDNNPGS